MLTLDEANDIVDYIKGSLDLGGHDDWFDIDVFEDYSGRGMHGKTTVAFKVPSEDGLLAIGFAAAKLDIDPDKLPTRIDDLGLGIVIY